MIIKDIVSVISTVRVGADSARLPGPLGAHDEGSQTPRTRDESEHPYCDEIETEIVPAARIVVHDGIELPCHDATCEQLRVMQNSLMHVPPSHLRLVNQRKPAGFHIRDSVGRGTSLRDTGGLNPSADYRETPDVDERRAILITRGAFRVYERLPVLPTVMHEIGHVMTHRGEINYERFDAERAAALRATRVSRHEGELEALCNAYMFFLCYASAHSNVRAFGTGTDDQNDRRTRDALRRCRAFRPRLLDEAWQARFAER